VKPGTLKYTQCVPFRMDAARPNSTQKRTGGLYRGSGLKPLALLENPCQRRSEDFVPPAA